MSPLNDYGDDRCGYHAIFEHAQPNSATPGSKQINVPKDASPQGTALLKYPPKAKNTKNHTPQG
jgi:hypothetical protein